MKKLCQGIVSMFLVAAMLMQLGTTFAAEDVGGITEHDTTTEETSVFEETTTEPEETTTAPEETTAAPEETTTAPEETTTAPEETTAEPEETTAAPEETTAAPEETTAAPEETTAASEETTAAPEDTTSTPEETTAEPEETTAEPEETTTAPAETTAEPEETTAEPEETTAEPEETTTEPEETTTALEATTKIDLLAEQMALFGLTTVASGACNSKVNWALYSDGTLAVTGMGAIPDFIDGVESAPWLDYADSITTVAVGEGITAIGECAFRYLANVVCVELPSTLETISMYAFDYCEKLESITLPDGLVSIGAWAFSYCRKLTAIDIPDSVTEIGDYVFYSSSLVSADLPSGITAIANGMFENCRKLESIDWEPTITSIGETAFAGCTSLELVEIPEGVEYIGSGAFRKCECLVRVAIPESATSLGENMFDLCPNLTLLVHEGSEGHNYALENDYPFEHVYVPIAIAYGVCGSTLEWEIFDNGEMFIKGTGAMLSDWTLDNPAPWYEHRNIIKTVSIESGATSIGAYAFYNCTNLVSIDIPSTVKTIGAYAFGYCSRLSDITIPTSVTTINAGTFYNCSSIKTLSIPTGVTSIGAYAFAGCRNLSGSISSSKIRTIGDYAFYGCASLTSVSFTYESTLFYTFSIGDYALTGCTSLESITVDNSSSRRTLSSEDGVLFNKAKTTLICYPAGKTDSSYTIPSTVTTISPYAFADARYLESVTISSNVSTIGDRAFKGCSSLVNVDIPTNVTSIGDYAFYDCGGMEKAVINPAGIAFGEDAFFRTSDNFAIYGYNDSTAQAYADEMVYPFVSLTPTEIELDDTIGAWSGASLVSGATNEYAHFGAKNTNGFSHGFMTVGAGFEVGTTYKLTFDYRNNFAQATTMRVFIAGVAEEGANLRSDDITNARGGVWGTYEFVFTPVAAGTGAITYNGLSRKDVASFDFDNVVITVVEPASTSSYTADQIIFSTNEADMHKSYYVDWNSVTLTGGTVLTEVNEYVSSKAQGEEADIGKLTYNIGSYISADEGACKLTANFRAPLGSLYRVLTYVNSKSLNYTHTDFNGIDIAAKVFFDNGEYVVVNADGASVSTRDIAPYIWAELDFTFYLDEPKNIVGIEFIGTATDIVVDGTVVTKKSSAPPQFDSATYTIDDVQTTAVEEMFDIYGLSIACKLTEEIVTHVPDEPVIEKVVAGDCTKPSTHDVVIYCAVCGEELSRNTVIGEVGDHSPKAAVREKVVEATCKAEGSYDEVVYCSVCDEEISRTVKTIAKLSHTPGNKVRDNEVAATCTAEGSYDEVVYCSVCGEEASRTTKTIAKLAHNYVNRVCSVCGETDPNSGGVLEDFEFFNILNEATSAEANATVIAPEGGWVDGENTFTVSSKLVCRVYLSADGISAYVLLDGTDNGDGTGTFTTDLTVDSMILIVVAGDANADGKLTNADATRLKAHLGEKKLLNATGLLYADASNDSKVTNTDVTRIKAAVSGKRALDW